MSEVLIDSYDPITSNVMSLYTDMPDAQSFTGAALKLTKAQFYLKKVAESSPTGNMYAKLYAHTGTFGVDGVPTGEPLATSGAVDASTLTDEFVLTDFVFTDEYVMSADTKYCIALFGVDDTDTKFDYETLEHGGVMSFDEGEGWYIEEPMELLFYVYGEEAAEPDTTPPVITLLGDAEVNVEVGGSYEDAGATAEDDVDGDITEDIVVGGDTVDTDTPGTYVITYNVSDSSDNAADEVTRTVNVVDTTPPVITRLGSATVNISVGDTYTDAGATALDNYDGDITGDIVTVNPVNTAVADTYTVTYNVSDSSDNPATEVTRTVVVAAVEVTKRKNSLKIKML